MDETVAWVIAIGFVAITLVSGIAIGVMYSVVINSGCG